MLANLVNNIDMLAIKYGISKDRVGDILEDAFLGMREDVDTLEEFCSLSFSELDTIIQEGLLSRGKNH